MMRCWIFFGCWGVWALGNAQQPFSVDTSFRTTISKQYVSSLLLLEDGKLMISGRMRFEGESFDRRIARLNLDGTRDVGFPGPVPGGSVPGGGKIIPWEGRFYVGTDLMVRRIWPDGFIDQGYGITTGSVPYFSPSFGGDYHVFPDGRVVMSGNHILSDSIRGFMGLHNFIWFTNTGYLDTTRTHRRGNNSISRFKELPDGKFICSGSLTSFEGQPVARILRLNADGSYDPSFQTGAYWGTTLAFHALLDGRVYVGGNYLRNDHSDTLRLARFMADGSLDPSFTPPIFGLEDLPIADGGISVWSLDPLDEAHIIVTGRFEIVNGLPRKGICMLDQFGNVLDVFDDCGIGPFHYTGPTISGTIATIQAIERSPNEEYFYISGGYNGYDDGTVNDTLQRFVSRLHGGDLTLNLGAKPEPILEPAFTLFPNPANTWVAINFTTPLQDGQHQVVARDISGRVVWNELVVEGQGQLVWDIRALAAGTYILALKHANGGIVHLERLIVQ